MEQTVTSTTALAAWNWVAFGVYAFALCVTLTLASGGLDPVGSAYYGIATDWRTPVLLILLAALQIVWIGDAIVIGLRRKSAAMWALLIAAAIVGPFTMLVLLGQLDGWRYDHRSPLTNLGIGAAMVLVVVTTYSLRRQVFRSTV